MSHNIYRKGKVHVLAERCSTCIFRKGNLMSLSKGRVKEMVASAVKNDSTIVCHQTLGTRKNAVCRGFFDGYATPPLQIADRLGIIEWQQWNRKA